MNNGLEKFSDLENKVYRTIELFKAVTLQKESREKEVLKLKSLLDQTQAEGERIKQESIELKKERDLVKGKIETILKNLDSLTP